jgi:hypothetical protein
MENYLPEWFNEQEFENFLAEGALTRKAWLEGLKRWRYTKFLIRQRLRNTPMKNISRTMKMKHNMIANTAIQNARLIQSAQDREEKMDAARNFIRQEQLDTDFENFLSEKLFSGSQTSFNLGVKPSAGERATMRNPTGDPKVQAREKKRIQRADEKIKVDEMVLEAKEKDSKSDNQPQSKEDNNKPQRNQNRNPAPAAKEKKLSTTEMVKKGDFSDVVVVETTKNKVKIMSRASLKSIGEGFKIIMNEKPGEIRNKEDLHQFIRKENFQRTETYNNIFDGLSPEEVVGEKKDSESKEGRRETAPRQRRQRADAIVLPPERRVPSNKLDYRSNELAPQISQLISDPQSTQLLKDMGWFGPKGEQLDEMQALSDSNPWISQVGLQTRDDAFAFANASNSNLQGKELFLLSLSGRQACLKMSEQYQRMGVKDRTSKADYLVFAKGDLGKFAKYLMKSENECLDIPKELIDQSVGISHKAGKSQLSSSSVTETLAVVEDVREMLMSVQEQLPEEIFKLIESFNKLKAFGDGVATFKVMNSRMGKSAIKRLSPEEAARLDAENQSNLVAAQQYFSLTDNVIDDVKKNLEELLSNDVVKAAFVYSFASGSGKFDEKSLGRANGFLFANDRGESVGTMNIPVTFKDALEDTKFMAFVKKHKLNARAKSWGGKNSRLITNYSSRLEARPQEIKNMFSGMINASYEMENNELDQLFEYTFLPPDRVIDTLSPTNAASLPSPELGPSQGQMMGFGQYADKQETFKFDLENIFPTLAEIGMLEMVDFNVVNYTDVGMELSAMESPIKNYVVINGVEYYVPVYNVELEEGFFKQYEGLNETMIQMVNDGIPLETVQEIFQNELMSLVEGKRNYKREYRLFHSKPIQRAKRSKRVLARRKMAKKLGKKAINGKDIDHRDGNALNNGDSNLRVRSINKNRADNGHNKKGLSEGNWLKRLTGSWEYTENLLKKTPGQAISKELIQLLSKNKGQSK